MFKCVADTKVHWLKEGFNLTYMTSEVQYGKTPGTDIYWLEISSVTLYDTAIYTCTAEEDFLIIYDEGVLEVICECCIYLRDVMYNHSYCDSDIID